MIRLLTLNLGGAGDADGTWAERMRRVAAAVVADGADVLVAQAAVDGDVCKLDALTGLLPEFEHSAFAPADGRVGSLVLSKFPLAATPVPLSLRPELEDANARVLLHVVVTTPEGRLHVLDAHFSWVDAQAEDNVREAVDYAAGLEGAVVLAGDLNQAEDRASMRALAAAGYVDAWRALKGDAPGFTFEVGRLWTRIDYIWVQAGLAAGLRDMRTVGGEGDLALSDHLGLSVAIELANGTKEAE